MRGKDITRSQFGDQLPRIISYMTERITVVGECWEFSPQNKDHYGLARPFEFQRFLTHRLMYAIVFGAISGDTLVCHTCDNPPCCRPHHLFEGTDADNQRDKIEKGRHVNPMVLRPEIARKGEDHPVAVLTEKMVREIRVRYAAGGVSYVKLAADYPVEWSSIRDVVKRRQWKHII